MITAEALTKRYGTTTAVDGLSFTAGPGAVTGFLGPNGAGKSTTMLLVLGLERPTAGTVTVDGRRYADLPSPLRTVGAMLDARSVHPGRTAFRHLLGLARTHGIPRSRVEEVIGLTGLEAVAGQRVRTFSLGMGQRLGIAGALLGDPGTLVLDEPVNGLDPDGVLWVRDLVRGLAAEGRTVFLSSHLMHELALCADRVVVLGRGRLLADASVRDLLERSAGAGLVRVRTTEPDVLARSLVRLGAEVAPQPDGVLHVRGIGAEEVGAAAGRDGVTVLELAAETGSLEAAYLELTTGSVQYRAGGAR
ncbi:ATP-binding cassette domain-containing protein [Kineococcus rhizosphaerae]|uniref:ABC-2 type transport system ATP-binding protein n=1 Tax=Kineococcus rhizosphaerae TaxID=559628 RepID=A0A2T0R0C1_9ACTN|nr:ATP-binding cassette domain-containing protein [Kineococcus rhizosphaerae]PRY12550.1 ABC-2 type transport system ATP-binding protein [Kineococcus rhizosphaerae]